jgi:hypothetical protein
LSARQGKERERVTFKTLRWLAALVLVFNVAFTCVALLWLATAISAYSSAGFPWPWWRDFDVVASGCWGGVSAFTVVVLWLSLRKTRRGPELDALQAREGEELHDLEAEVQRAELQKRLRDLTRAP